MTIYQATEEATTRTPTNPGRCRVKLFCGSTGTVFCAADLHEFPLHVCCGDRVTTDKGRTFEVSDAKVSVCKGVAVRVMAKVCA